MKSNNDKKWTVADVLTNFGKNQAQVQQEKQLKQQLKEALMKNQAQALGQFVPGMEQQMPFAPQDMSLEQSYEQAKQGGIHIDPSKKGTFKAQATRMGMGIQEAAEHILSNKDSYSSGMVRKANFARNFAKEEGGQMMRYGAGGDMMACPEGLYWDGQKCVEIPKQISDRNMQTYFTNPPSYGVTDNSGNSLYDGSDVERAKGFYARGSEYGIIPPEGTPRSILPNPVDMLRQLNEQNSDVLRNAALRKKQLSEIEVNENWNRLSNKIEKENDGGEMLNEYGRGGYTVSRSNDRKGKTHVVTGPDGTKKYFGDPNMGERSKSKYGKDAFYARHADSLKKNPYFRAYARATWEDGGETNEPCPPGMLWDPVYGCIPISDKDTKEYSPEQINDYFKSYERTSKPFRSIEENINPDYWNQPKSKFFRKLLDDNNVPYIETLPNKYTIPKDELTPEQDSQLFHINQHYTKKKLEILREMGVPPSEWMNYIQNMELDEDTNPFPSNMENEKFKELYQEIDNQYEDNIKDCPCRKKKEIIVQGKHTIKEVCVPCEQAEYGGEMIKRADGSYSQRGLWDNIRANKGSGNDPTREMIEQERKIRKKAMGGIMGPSDCEEGFTWNDTYQTCVPIGQKIIDPQTGENYLKDWYSKRLNVINNPGYAEAVGAENVKGQTKFLNQVVPLAKEQLDNYVPTEYVDEIEGMPNATGEYVDYDRETPVINIKRSSVVNPIDFAATQVHEGSTYANQKAWDKFLTPTQNRIIEQNTKPWQTFLKDNTTIDKSNKNAVRELEDAYNYSIDPQQDNVHSNVHATRYLFNLLPDEIITEDKIKSMIEEGTQKGYLDRSSPNYHDDFYRLLKLSRDNKSLVNLFNLLASDDTGLSDNDLQMAKHGGNIGNLRKFF